MSPDFYNMGIGGMQEVLSHIVEREGIAVLDRLPELNEMVARVDGKPEIKMSLKTNAIRKQMIRLWEMTNNRSKLSYLAAQWDDGVARLKQLMVAIAEAGGDYEAMKTAMNSIPNGEKVTKKQ